MNALLSLAILGIVSITSCQQNQTTTRLIKEINEAKINARNLVNEGESKRKEAGTRRTSGDEAGRRGLMEEAAKHYAQASEILNEAAKKADELSQSKNPEWYEEYFRLHAKLIRNLARMGNGAHDETLVRIDGAPTEAQLETWREDLNRINKENDELRGQITALEARHRVVLITE